MHVPNPPGFAGEIVSQLAEMVPAPRPCVTVGAFLALASSLFARRYKDQGGQPINLSLITATPAFSCKTRMVTALGRAIHAAVMGADAGAGISTARPHNMTASPFETARQLHVELMRCGSAAFAVDEFHPSLMAMTSSLPLRYYLARTFDAGMPVKSLSLVDSRAGSIGEPSGAVEVWNPSLTIWGLCTPYELPDLAGDFYDRWLIMRDDRRPTLGDDMRAFFACRTWFDTNVASKLREWIIQADALDEAYSAAAIQDPAGKRPPLTSPMALAEIEMREIYSLTWSHGALEALVPLASSGRALQLARRVACLVSLANGKLEVQPDVAAWAAAFVAFWQERRQPAPEPKPEGLPYEAFQAIGALAVTVLDRAAWPMPVEAAEKRIAARMKLAAVPKYRAAATLGLAHLNERGIVKIIDMGGRLMVVPDFLHVEWSRAPK